MSRITNSTSGIKGLNVDSFKSNNAKNFGDNKKNSNTNNKLNVEEFNLNYSLGEVNKKSLKNDNLKFEGGKILVDFDSKYGKNSIDVTNIYTDVLQKRGITDNDINRIKEGKITIDGLIDEIFGEKFDARKNSLLMKNVFTDSAAYFKIESAIKDSINEKLDKAISEEINKNIKNVNDFYNRLEEKPNWSNAWSDPSINRYTAQDLYGQCTWFAYGKFYETYGYRPWPMEQKASGKDCANVLVSYYPDKFSLSNTPTVGSVGSYNDGGEYGHVFFVTKVEGDKVTIQEGNKQNWLVGGHSFEEAQDNWQEKTYTISELNSIYPGSVYANPIDGAYNARQDS